MRKILPVSIFTRLAQESDGTRRSAPKAARRWSRSDARNRRSCGDNRHQRRQQAGESFAGPRRVGGGERRLRNPRAADVIKLRGLALEARLDVVQTARPAEL